MIELGKVVELAAVGSDAARADGDREVCNRTLSTSRLQRIPARRREQDGGQLKGKKE